MAEQKTKPTEQSVDAFLDSLASEQARADCDAIVKIMRKVTGAAPKMWGASIVGFGNYHYKYDRGQEGDSVLTGFSPRKAAITLYVIAPGSDHASLLEKLGKHKAGKGCLYVKKLADIDVKVLEELIDRSVTYLQTKYGH